MQAAQCLCKTSGWKLSYLELQKILYICNMLYLGATGEPLVEGNFEAWDYGPVHPVLHLYLQSYGLESIPKNAFDNFVYDKELNSKEEKMLTETAKRFSDIPKSKLKPKLIAITHQEVSAWRRKHRPSLKGIRGIRILNEDIEKEYKRRKKKQLAEIQ